MTEERYPEYCRWNLWEILIVLSIMRILIMETQAVLWLWRMEA